METPLIKSDVGLSNCDNTSDGVTFTSNGRWRFKLQMLMNNVYTRMPILIVLALLAAQCWHTVESRITDTNWSQYCIGVLLLLAIVYLASYECLLHIQRKRH